MLIKAFLNAHGLNELLAGGSAAGRSRPDGNFLLEGWFDSHEYDMAANIDPTIGLGSFTIAVKRPKYAAPQQVQQAVAPAPAARPAPTV